MSFPRPDSGRTVPSPPTTARAWRLACGWFLEAVAVFILLLAAGPGFSQETHSRGAGDRHGKSGSQRRYASHRDRERVDAERDPYPAPTDFTSDGARKDP